jgi:hypothetical protein
MESDPKGSGIAARIKNFAMDAATAAASRRFGLRQSAVHNLSSFKNLSGNAAGSLPTELLALGADMWTGFAYTPFAEQQMDGWVFPYWLDRQRTPASSSFVPHGHFWLECNMTHRNWTGIGICGYPHEATVDERGLITPWPFAPSIDVWVKVGDTLFCPSERDGVTQQLVAGFPIIRTSFDALGIEVVLTAFVAPVNTVPVALCLCEATNAHCQAAAASLVVSVRPANIETLCAINELGYDAPSRTFTADGGTILYLGSEPDRVLLSDYFHGDVAQQLRDPRRERLAEGTAEVSEPFGLATGAAVFDLELAGGADSKVCFAAPLGPALRPALHQMLPSDSSVAIVEKKLAEQRLKWAGLTGEGMCVSIPDETWQKAFDFNKAYLLLLFDGSAITPGVATYHMMWFRDAAYLVPALEKIGHLDKARDVLATYAERQMPDGYFRSHSGEWDSNGQAMYTLAHHYRMTGDEDFIKGLYPALMKGARWIEANLARDLPASDPRRGLLPPGISAEHFGMGDVYYWDDFWAVGGLRAVGNVARDLGFTEDGAYCDRVADDIWDSLEISWASVEKRLGRRVMPIAPDRDVDSGSIGVVSSVYPLGLIGAGEEIMANTIRELIDTHFYHDVYYHGILHCGYNAYLSLQVAQCLLQARDPYALQIFESLMTMATQTLTFPEAINPLTGGGAYGDGHHGWAVCEFLNFLRNVMLVEEGDRLVLLPLARPEWFGAGKTIKVENAPTFFGEVTYTVECEDDVVTFTLAVDPARAPRAVVLNVPFDIASCEVDGKSVEVAQEERCVEVSPGTRTVTIKPAS